MATYWENSCSFGLRYVSWYKYLIVSLVFSHLGFWSGNLFLIAPFPDLCLLVPYFRMNVNIYVLNIFREESIKFVFLKNPPATINETAIVMVTAKLISAFVFATRIVQFIFYLNPKFQASSSLLCLYSLVSVGPVGKPHCWFSQEAAQYLL